ncbi:MAG: PBP1A family penicillin-binding protein, partial [Deltaproteobacteria bacterium]|nr:PBP1A family penicillin-binding protein [Deltaproteobacteria bacterium]
QQAVLAAEDARFYSHHGIDAVGVARAVVRNLREWRFAQGGSTITQQLAKNFFLSPKKTIVRKLREAELALALELRYTKKAIFGMYLNKIYFGQEGARGIYGVEEAASFYFSKPAADLTLEESATLAGVIRSPNRYSPFRAPAAAEERRNVVLARMRHLGMIGEREYRQASRAPLRTRARRSPAKQAAYFADYIQRVTEDDLGGGKLFRTGYRFYTTLDPVQQAAAEEAVVSGLAELERTGRPSAEPLQAALVAVDPSTGEMTAMVGGRGYGMTQFNRATDAKRQPGSAFKPFVLLAAMERAAAGNGKTTLSTIVSGAPVTVPGPKEPWTPSNFDGKVYGDISVRKALEDSVNTATVRLALDAGLPAVVKTARAAGIRSPLFPVPSVALGSFEVTPVELAYAYATIASGGIRYQPFPLFSVTTADGEILTSAKVRWERTLDPRAAYLTGYAMQGVLERGTAKTAREMGIYFPASGKTGTTDGNRDSWFVGYTPDVVCAVWVGRDSGADTGLTGARGALRIWASFLRSLYPGSGPVTLLPPEGIDFAEIDPASGFLATTACPETLQEAYLSGTEPKEHCPLHPVNPVVDTFRRGMRDFSDYIRNLFK